MKTKKEDVRRYARIVIAVAIGITTATQYIDLLKEMAAMISGDFGIIYEEPMKALIMLCQVLSMQIPKTARDAVKVIVDAGMATIRR